MEEEREETDVCMGGDLRGLGGRCPPNFEVGDGPCIRPPRQKTDKIRSMTKKLSEIFGVKNGNFFLKRSFENLVCKIFFHPPKLGAKSPPMDVRVAASCITMKYQRSK